MHKGAVASLLATIAVVALIGNAAVVILLIKKRDWLKKVHSCLLLALAVQDVLTAIGLFVLPGFVQSSDPYRLPESEWLIQLYCSVVWSRYIPFSLAITSVYTCFMLAVDRWVAVFRPMSYKQFSVSGKVIATMVVLPWFAGFGFEINTALSVKYLVNNDGTGTCIWEKIDTSPKGRTIAVFTFIGMIILPAILMILVYAKIVFRRRKQAARISPQLPDIRRHDSISVSSTGIDLNRGSESTPSLKKLTIIACSASAVILVCWLPDQFYFCLFQLGLVDLRTELHDCLIILAFLNTCLNPFLYFFTNKKYTEAFASALCFLSHREVTDSTEEQQIESKRT